MVRDDIVQKVLYYLEANSFDSCEDEFKQEIQATGDAQIDSILFVEVAGQLEGDLGIVINPRVLHKRVKNSLNDFCDYVLELVKEGVDHGKQTA